MKGDISPESVRIQEGSFLNPIQDLQGRGQSQVIVRGLEIGPDRGKSIKEDGNY